MPELNWPSILERKYSCSSEQYQFTIVRDPATGLNVTKFRPRTQNPHMIRDKDDLFQYHSGLRECNALQLQLPRPLYFDPESDQHWDLCWKIIRNRNWTDYFGDNLGIHQSKREFQFPKLDIWEMSAQVKDPRKYAALLGRDQYPVRKKKYVFETWDAVRRAF